MFVWLTEDLYFSDRCGHIVSFDDMKFYDSLQEERYYSQKELLEVFPLAASYFKEKLKDLKCLAQEKNEEVRKASIRYAESGLKNKWFHEMCLENRKQEYEKLKKDITRVQWIVSPRSKVDDNGITDSDIEAAKHVSFSDFLEVRHDGFAHCPFHEEKTASFKVFKNNRWWCFGACYEGGDLIDFIVKKYDVSFLEAVKILIKK